MSATMDLLKNRAVVVTGAATGIGRAIAMEVAKEGGSVAIADIARGPGEETARRIAAEGGDACYVECDVAEPTAARQLASETVRRFGRIDGLVNNAALSANGSVESCDYETWRQVLAVNLSGPFLCSQACLPYLRESRPASIVNIASVSAYWGEAGSVAYNASKGGVLALTRAMAMDHSHEGVRVNCVCPGFQDEGMGRRWLAETGDTEALTSRLTELIAMRRLGRPSEVARLVTFLLSNASDYVTGAAMVIDGGMTAGYPWF